MVTDHPKPTNDPNHYKEQRMTKISLAAALAAGGIDHLADELFDDLGSTIPAVVLLEVTERTEPADSEGAKKVKLQVVGIETPLTDASKRELHQQLRDMYARRTQTDALFGATSDVLKHGSGLLDSSGTTLSFNGGPEVPIEKFHAVTDALADGEDS